MNIKSETEQWQTKYYKNIDTNDPFFVVKLAYFMKTAKKTSMNTKTQSGQRNFADVYYFLQCVSR